MDLHNSQKNPLLNSSSTILMVRPSNFGSNPQTLSDNAFQQSSKSQTESEHIKQKAIQQFDRYVLLLKNQGVNIIVVQDTKEIIKPDAIFPNNWFSTHRNGNIIIYPMKPVSRRAEKSNPVIETLKAGGYVVTNVLDLSQYESAEYHIPNQPNPKIGKYLQGTGSMVLDHQNKLAYACKSQRTNPQLFTKYCTEIIHYKPISFTACDKNNMKYYHTNVIMSVCSDFVIVCLEAILDNEQREIVVGSIEGSKGSTGLGKELVQITVEQVGNFCGNVLQVCNQSGQKIITMSETAYKSYNKSQLDIISKYCKILKVDIPCVQTYGGGGSRCMMAEIFLPKTQ